MRILFAIKALDDAVGGAERVLCLLATEMARRGHAVSVLTYDRPGGRAYFNLPDDVRRLALGIGRTDRPAAPGETLRRMVALRHTVRAERPNIVVAFMPSMFVPLGLALLGTAVPLIASERNAAALYDDRPGLWALLQMTPLLARRITVVSDRVKAGYTRLLQRSMVVIPNAVELPPAIGADPRGGARKTLLAVGSLTPLKDHRTLVDAFAFLAGGLPDWDLRIVGEGPLRRALEQQVAAGGLERRISLPGATRDVMAEYARAQLYVMPSRSEGFAGALAEALAHGLPAIGFAACPGINDLIKSGTNGLLVDGADRVRALAEGLRTLMGDDHLRVRQGAAAPARLAEFDPARVYDQWERLLEEHARAAPDAGASQRHKGRERNSTA